MAGTLKQVRIIVACAYGDVGHKLTPNGTLRDWLIGNGLAVIDEAATPARPAKLAGKAAKKLADAAAGLFKH